MGEEGCGATGGSGEIVGAAFFFFSFYSEFIFLIHIFFIIFFSVCFG